VISLLKKLLAAMFALLCVFMLCACANQTSDPDNKVQDSDISDEMQQNPADVDIPPVSDPGPDPVTDPVEDPAPVPDDEKDMQVSLEEVRAAILDQLSINDPLLLETDMLEGLYGITADMLKQSASFVTMSGTFPDEVILTEAVDDAAAEAVAAALQKRLDEVMVQSKTYDAENYEAAQQCKVSRNGLFVALILSPKQGDMVSVYEGFVS